MIVDEDKIVVNYLYALFKLSGYEVNMAFSAKECLGFLEQSNPDNIDAALVDGKIAEDKGAMVVSRIKQLNKVTKILVVANNDNPKNIILEYGADDFVIKPVSAKAYPNSRFVGFDNHQASKERARELAREEGLSEERIKFKVSSASDYPLYSKDTEKYDLIAFFDALHDMGDPIGAASHALKSLKPEGTVMIVEPFANDKIEDNLNPVSRMFYAASTMICVPGSMAFNGPALGAQAGEAKIGEVVKAGGFKQFRRATETQFNIVYEARP